MDGERENFASLHKVLMSSGSIIGAASQYARIRLARIVLRLAVHLVDWIAPWSAETPKETGNV